MRRWHGSVAAIRSPPLPPRLAEGLPLRLARVDWLLVLTVTAIAAIGAAMLYSAAGGNATPWAGRHGIRYVVGIIIMLAIALAGIRRCFAMAYIGYAVCFVLLIVVEVAGSGAGATRWIDLGVMRLQPSELMKIALILALARLLHDAGPDSAD
ncbi:MAG: FtsW/RodA/SpoVE family cell cycle protein, partial [Alphaproteobacteria bacterium]